MPIKRICPTSGAIIYKRTPEEAELDHLRNLTKTLQSRMDKFESLMKQDESKDK